jgi:hypothetical protein
MKCRRDEVIVNCPQCGRESPVTKGMKLVACWKCAMGLADEVDVKEREKQAAYDWDASLKNICKAKGWSQKSLAYRLKLNPVDLTHIKKGRRTMPKLAFQELTEKHARHMVLAEKS